MRTMLMRSNWTWCLLLLLAGCSKSADSTQNRPPIQPLQGGNLYPPPPAEGQAYPIEYQGRSAHQLGADLSDGDPYATQEATKALANLGEPGFRQLVGGLNSSSWETRLLCLKAFTREAVLENGHYAV